ncbi:MAG: PEP-utilizing enzyme [Minisyncoccia bacterium]
MPNARKAPRFVPKKKHTSPYVLTFEGKGISVLYESILLAHYVPYESVSVLADGHVREYISRDVQNRMGAAGHLRTYDEVNRAITAMDAAIRKAETIQASHFSSPLKQDVLIAALTHAGTLAACYGYFDTHYWEGVYDRAVKSTETERVIHAVEAYRNNACAAYDRFFFGTHSYLSELLTFLGRETHTASEDLACYTADELKAYIKDEYRLRGGEIAKRKAFCVLERSPQGIVTLRGAERARKYAESLSGVYTKAARLEGVVTGKVAHALDLVIYGPARILVKDYRNPEAYEVQTRSVCEGDIIISQTIDPTMVPLLRSAAALITDVGGMLSHAAIVARELGIPCIVATGSATTIFSPDEMLEVDTISGVVRRMQ